MRILIVALLGILIGCQSRPESAPAEAFPSELTSFRQVGQSPVFTGSPGQWDALIRERGWIVVEDGLWKLYYTGYADAKDVRRLGLATSRDGIEWTRHAGNPLVKDQWIEDMMVVKDGNGWYMVAEGKDDQAHAFTSRDGIAWTRLGPLDVRKTDGQPIDPGPYGSPVVFVKDGLWHLFYERGDRGVWLATSKDKTVWTHVQDDPVLVPGPDDYDRDLIALNQIIEHKGRYFAYYHGCKNDPDKSKRKWATGVAVSRDLRQWNKFPGNPIVPLEENRSSGFIVPIAGGFRLYTTHPEVWAYESR